ncbi:uncharacterized protein METZ01_LOCUS446821, partial [marine metagenome]
MPYLIFIAARMLFRPNSLPAGRRSNLSEVKKQPRMVGRGLLCLELGAVGLLEFEGSVEQGSASFRHT